MPEEIESLSAAAFKAPEQASLAVSAPTIPVERMPVKSDLIVEKNDLNPPIVSKDGKAEDETGEVIKDGEVTVKENSGIQAGDSSKPEEIDIRDKVKSQPDSDQKEREYKLYITELEDILKKAGGIFGKENMSKVLISGFSELNDPSVENKVKIIQELFKEDKKPDLFRMILTIIYAISPEEVQKYFDILSKNMDKSKAGEGNAGASINEQNIAAIREALAAQTDKIPELDAVIPKVELPAPDLSKYTNIAGGVPNAVGNAAEKVLSTK